MATASASTNFGSDTDDFYIDQSFIINPGITDVSIFAWVYLSDEGPTENIIIAQRDGSGTGRNWLMHFSGPNTYGTFLGGSGKFSNTSQPGNLWVFFGLTCAAGASQTLTYYLNGEPDGTATITMEAATGEHRLGAHKGLGNDPWGGNIVYTQMFDTVVSSETVKEMIYNPFSQSENLVWFPDLLESNGYRDLSPDQRGAGTAVGTLTPSSDGPPVGMLYGAQCQ